MIFNSVDYGLFLIIVFCLYWSIKENYRWIILLISSYFFYAYTNPQYLILIMAITMLSYIGGLGIEKYKKNKKLILSVSIVGLTTILVYFKYFGFLLRVVSDLFGTQNNHLNFVDSIILPVGISFYTFQTIGYLIDVYRENIKAEKHLGYFATFISFFPQLVAGPIERTKNLLPQIKQKAIFSYKEATYGLKLMAWGYYKKIAVADVLCVYVDKIFDDVYAHSGFSLIIASIFFTIQIYCDFSGYSDIAIGTAKLFGINLMKNFDSPYFSSSIKEFWNRWHISLSSWLKDYIYIPLGGNRVSALRHRINLIITFFISGIWHGANYTYLLWGLMHGFGVVAESFVKIKKERGILSRIAGTLITFCFCVIAWVLFRAQSIEDAIHVLTKCFVGIQNGYAYIRKGFNDMDLNRLYMIQRLPFMILLPVYDYFSLKKDVIKWISEKKLIIRWIIYLMIIFVIVICYPYTERSQFIYFRF